MMNFLNLLSIASGVASGHRTPIPPPSDIMDLHSRIVHMTPDISTLANTEDNRYISETLQYTKTSNEDEVAEVDLERRRGPADRPELPFGYFEKAFIYEELEPEMNMYIEHNRVGMNSENDFKGEAITFSKNPIYPNKWDIKIIFPDHFKDRNLVQVNLWAAMDNDSLFFGDLFFRKMLLRERNDFTFDPLYLPGLKDSRAIIYALQLIVTGDKTTTVAPSTPQVETTTRLVAGDLTKPATPAPTTPTPTPADAAIIGLSPLYTEDAIEELSSIIEGYPAAEPMDIESFNLLRQMPNQVHRSPPSTPSTLDTDACLTDPSNNHSKYMLSNNIAPASDNDSALDRKQTRDLGPDVVIECQVFPTRSNVTYSSFFDLYDDFIYSCVSYYDYSNYNGDLNPKTITVNFESQGTFLAKDMKPFRFRSSIPRIGSMPSPLRKGILVDDSVTAISNAQAPILLLMPFLRKSTHLEIKEVVETGRRLSAGCLTPYTNNSVESFIGLDQRRIADPRERMAVLGSGGNYHSLYDYWECLPYTLSRTLTNKEHRKRMKIIRKQERDIKKSNDKRSVSIVERAPISKTDYLDTELSYTDSPSKFVKSSSSTGNTSGLRALEVHAGFSQVSVDLWIETSHYDYAGGERGTEPVEYILRVFVDLDHTYFQGQKTVDFCAQKVITLDKYLLTKMECKLPYQTWMTFPGASAGLRISLEPRYPTEFYFQANGEIEDYYLIFQLLTITEIVLITAGVTLALLIAFGSTYYCCILPKSDKKSQRRLSVSSSTSSSKASSVYVPAY